MDSCCGETLATVAAVEFRGGIVARIRCSELSSPLLQFRPISGRILAQWRFNRDLEHQNGTANPPCGGVGRGHRLLFGTQPLDLAERFMLLCWGRDGGQENPF